MLILEISQAVHGDIALLAGLQFVVLNFCQGLSDRALVFSQLLLVKVLARSVLDAFAPISEPSDAEQSLNARSGIRESAQNQHRNPSLVIFGAEVQASAAELLVDEVNREPAACFDIHLLDLCQVKLRRDLGDPFLSAENIVVHVVRVDEHSAVCALLRNEGTSLFKLTQLELLVDGRVEVFLLRAICVDFEVESVKTRALQAVLTAVVSSCSEANGADIIGLDAFVERIVISEDALVTFIDDEYGLFAMTNTAHVCQIVDTFRPLQRGLVTV